jgi:NMD protein affecting ribosome stability and mRNA decay
MSSHVKASRYHTLGTTTQGQRGVGEDSHDPYRLQAKPREPTYCPACGAVFEEGRWQWKERLSSKAPQRLCSACQRIRDGLPAGYLQIDGEFAREHRTELHNLIAHRAERAKAEHPMQRIMAITEQGDGLEVTTTDVHLARDLGEALHRAYHGELALRYGEGQMLLRAHWRR